MTANGTVVVGVDGSPESRTAIDYALQEAARRNARLQVIAAAQLPEYWAIGYGMAPAPTPEQIAREMWDAAKKQVDEVRSAHPELTAVPVAVEAKTGLPGQVLVDAAEGADVLVLGHRGRGAVRSALLGSVGLHCILYATCPVTIVRQPAIAERSLTAATAAARA